MVAVNDHRYSLSNHFGRALVNRLLARPCGNDRMQPQHNLSAETFQAQQRLGTANGQVDYEQIRQLVDSVVPVNDHVGVRVIEVGFATAVAEVSDRHETRNHLGTVHAAVMFLAAETACAGAFSGGLAARVTAVQSFVLREARTTFFRPAAGRIRATATVDDKALSTILSGEGQGPYEISGKALLNDDAGKLVGKVDFDYACWLKSS